MTTAKMPACYCTPDKVGDMQIGDECSVMAQALVITEPDRETFVSLRAPVYQANDGMPKVRRTEGGFVLDIRHLPKARYWTTVAKRALQHASVARVHTILARSCAD